MKPMKFMNLIQNIYLLEIFRMPNEHDDEFKSVETFKFLNTNNISTNLSAFDHILNEKTLNMEIVAINKTLDNGLHDIQLKTAVGAAIKCFHGAIGINVPLSHFLPVINIRFTSCDVKFI